MEQTLEGWRQAGAIVSRWVWTHLKVREPEGADISSMPELLCEKPCTALETHRLMGFHLLSALKEGRGTLCGLGSSTAGCELPAVAGWGKQSRKGEKLSVPELPEAFTVGGIWEMCQGEHGLILTWGWEGKWLSWEGGAGEWLSWEGGAGEWLSWEGGVIAVL